MKDQNNQTLHIGEKVTFTEEARPKWLIGRLGTIERWGEKRIKVKISKIADESERFVRIEPAMLIRGSHTIANKELMHVYWAVSEILDQAIKDKVISESQRTSLIRRLTGL